MSSFKRRRFLQFAGSTLAATGLSQIDFLRQANRYGNALAQGSSGRKLALLVGINTYQVNNPDPKLPFIRNLKGALTDVELQWHLLVYRFGFNPKDIIVIAERTIDTIGNEVILPTRENILNQFQEHLIKQAKQNDVVVFHYSGHGSYVNDSSSPFTHPHIPDRRVSGTIVPQNSIPDNNPNPQYVNDITGKTLFLLTRSLATENVTVILDSCYSGGGTRGNFVFRTVESRTNNPDGDLPSPQEEEIQQQLIRNHGLPDRSKVAKGVVIGSSEDQQYSAEAPYDTKQQAWSGAFTYLLTRYLWQSPSNPAVNDGFDKLGVSTAERAMTQNITQLPVPQGNPISNLHKPFFFLTPSTPSADAVVQKVKDNGEIEFWLGGVSTWSFIPSKSVFSVLDAEEQEIAQIEQTGRKNLVGYGRLRQGSLGAVKEGAFLREVIRGIPPKPVLKVSIDSSLGSEKDAAKQALEAIGNVEVVPPIEASYVLGRVTNENLAQIQSALPTATPEENSIGLFHATDLRPLPDSFKAAPVEDVVERLRARLKSILAAQILTAMTASDVATISRTPALRVSLDIVPITGNLVSSSTTLRIVKVPAKGKPAQAELRLINNDKRNLYVAVVAFNGDGSLDFLYPPNFNEPEIAALLEKGKAAQPQKINLNPAGFVELMTLVSTEPVRDMLLALKRIAEISKLPEGSSSTRGENFSQLFGDLLNDLDNTSRTGNPKLSREVSVVNRKQFTAISTIIQIVE